MRIDTTHQATCATCANFDATPNPFSPQNGSCDATLDDGLPPFNPLCGISPDRPACTNYKFKKQ